MNKIVITVVTIAALSVATIVHADGGCCSGHGSSAKVGQKDMSASLSKLNLTDAQKAKVDVLTKECTGAGCTEAGHAKFMTGLKEVLTAEQWDQFKADCHKGAGGCAAAAKDKAQQVAGIDGG